MEESPITIRQVSIKFGLILTVISIAFFIVVDMIGQVGNQALQWVGLIFSVTCIVLAHVEFKRANDSYMSFGEGFRIGFFITAISAVVSSVFTYLYVSFINTEFSEILKDKQIRDMEARGMSEAEIDQAMQFAGWFTTPEAILILGLFFALLFGIIQALIISAITKNARLETL